jgi:hypothetical protein
MPGRHQHKRARQRHRRGLSWLAAAAAGVAGLGATVLALSATDSAAAAPTPSYHAGSDTATFTVLGVLDSNCLVSTGGTEVWIKPGDAINFTSSLVGIDLAGLNVSLGAVAGLDVSAVIDGGTTHKQSFSVSGGKTTPFPGTKYAPLGPGDHKISWTATGVPLVGGLITLPLSVNDLKSGASLSWTGVIHVTNDAPQCKLSVSTPKTQISVGPIKVSVPPVTVTLPGVTIPTTLPSVPNLNPTPGKTGGAPKPGGKTTSASAGLLPVPARVVPQGNGDGVFGNIGTGGYNAGSPPGGTTRLGNNAPLLPVSKSTATSSAAARQNSTGKDKTIDLAAGRPASSQIPVILAILAMIALVLVAGTYARLFLLRRPS